MSRKPDRGKDRLDQDETPLEYYQAKHQPDEAKEAKKKKQQQKSYKSSTPDDRLRSSADGYVPIKSPAEKEREFERYQEITFAQKASDKAKQNPMIPIGMLATLAALTLGLRAMSRGDRWQSQMMMRARIGAQGFTIFAVLASIMYAGQTQKPNPPSSSSSSLSNSRRSS